MKGSRLLPNSADRFAPDQHFNGIDLAKFIGAYLVCLIHIQPFNMQFYEGSFFVGINFIIQQYLCRLAVPFYFVTSGFLLFRKIDLANPDKNRVKGYCFRLLRLLGTWSFLLFVGLAGHLWYLGALVLAVVLLYMLLKKGVPVKWIVIFAVIAFAIGLLGNSYYGIVQGMKHFSPAEYFFNFYERVFRNTRNGVFFGFLYVLMGALFAHRRIVLKTRTAVIGLSVSMALLLLELCLLKGLSQPKAYDMAIMQAPAIFFLFYLVVHWDLGDRPIYGKMRVTGMLIFYTHRIFLFFAEYAVTVIYHHTDVNLTPLICVASIAATTAVAFGIEHLAKKERFRWLRYLYS